MYQPYITDHHQLFGNSWGFSHFV